MMQHLATEISDHYPWMTGTGDLHNVVFMVAIGNDMSMSRMSWLNLFVMAPELVPAKNDRGALHEWAH